MKTKDREYVFKNFGLVRGPRIVGQSETPGDSHRISEKTARNQRLSARLVTDQETPVPDLSSYFLDPKLAWHRVLTLARALQPVTSGGNGAGGDFQVRDGLGQCVRIVRQQGAQQEMCRGVGRIEM